MRHALYLLLLLAGLQTWLPRQTDAAGNPVLDALAQGAVVQFSGREAISEPFAFDIVVAAADKALNLSLVAGQPFTIAVAPGRVISGMIERIEQIDGPGAQGLYRLQIVPSAKRLKYRSTSRTFYGKNVTEIIGILLAEAGVSNVEMRMTSVLPPQDVTIQYRESDFAFMSRLLERAGVHYHIESFPGGDKIVFSDGNAGFPASPIGKLLFSTNAVPAVFSFARGQSVYSGLVQASDYNWEAPAVVLTSVAQTPVFADLTERVFPAHVGSKAEAQAIANIRLGSHLTEAQVCSGESSHPQLQAGHRVILGGHPRAEFNQEYVITAVEHQKTAKDYRNTFRCLPSQVVYRPQQTTPVPVVSGVVSGIVVGPAGETKFVDKFGRVKVRFPWRAVEKSSFDIGDSGFVRVAQVATGAGASSLWLPDVGDEVLVAFEHGDPSSPVVIGSLYNAKDMPPVALPANKFLSLLRVQSENGPKNELLLDSTPGSERVLLQSGPNSLTFGAGGIALQGTSVTMNSAGDFTQRAGRNMVVDIAGDATVKSGQNFTLTAQRDAALSISRNSQFNTGGVLRATVGSDAQISIGSNLQATVGGSTVAENGKDLSVTAGQNLLIQTARTARLTVGEDAVIQTGKSFMTNSGAMFQFVAAQTGMTKVGDASFTLQRDGDLNLAGKDVAVVSSGNLTMKSSKELILKGSKITQN